MRPDLHSRPYEELGKEDFSAPASGTQLEVHFSIIPWQTERYFTRVMINVRMYIYAAQLCRESRKFWIRVKSKHTVRYSKSTCEVFPGNLMLAGRVGWFGLPRSTHCWQTF